jgi:hypothetical protein
MFPAKPALGLDPRVEIRFAVKEMCQQKKLQRFPFIWDHRAIPYERKTLQRVYPEEADQ